MSVRFMIVGRYPESHLFQLSMLYITIMLNSVDNNPYCLCLNAFDSNMTPFGKNSKEKMIYVI